MTFQNFYSGIAVDEFYNIVNFSAVTQFDGIEELYQQLRAQSESTVTLSHLPCATSYFF